MSGFRLSGFCLSRFCPLSGSVQIFGKKLSGNRLWMVSVSILSSVRIFSGITEQNCPLLVCSAKDEIELYGLLVSLSAEVWSLVLLFVIE